VAVGILMARHGIDEQASFERLRTQARAERRRISALAGEVVQSSTETARQPSLGKDGPHTSP
jgi:AmiR/NasT family two-component response regulator